MEFKDYRKYKWFYTNSGNLVVGGKNSEQNDILLNKIKSMKKNLILMHTAEPGSPFSVIFPESKKIGKKDIEECAIFTASFSRAWKLKKRKAIVHIFSSSQIYKDKSMKSGTWGVSGKIEKIEVPLLLVLTKQKSLLRAVPEASVKNKKEIIVEICPGNIPKEEFAAKFALEIGLDLEKNELLAALPAGGIKINR